MIRDHGSPRFEEVAFRGRGIGLLHRVLHGEARHPRDYAAGIRRGAIARAEEKPARPWSKIMGSVRGRSALTPPSALSDRHLLRGASSPRVALHLARFALRSHCGLQGAGSSDFMTSIRRFRRPRRLRRRADGWPPPISTVLRRGRRAPSYFRLEITPSMRPRRPPRQPVALLDSWPAAFANRPWRCQRSSPSTPALVPRHPVPGDRRAPPPRCPHRHGCMAGRRQTLPEAVGRGNNRTGHRHARPGRSTSPRARITAIPNIGGTTGSCCRGPPRGSFPRPDRPRSARAPDRSAA